jgi:hypothetical protein
MERTRAAKAYVDARRDAGIEMFAFLSLFHPEMDDATKRELARDATAVAASKAR